MKRIQGVIFDMDGVLIDAKEWHYDALNKALSLFGLNICRDAHENEFDGLPTKDKLRRISAVYNIPEYVQRFINEMKQRYTMDIVSQRCVPTAHHQLALSNLMEAGYRMAVASNSIRNSVDTMLDRADLNQYFDFTLCNEDVVLSKPSPEIYVLAMNKLKLEPHQCVIVEDNPHGIAAAKASGANVLEVNCPLDVNWQNISDFIKFCDAKS